MLDTGCINGCAEVTIWKPGDPPQPKRRIGAIPAR